MFNDNTVFDEADVVIVGGGLAGALLSFELTQQGHEVICLDAGPEVSRSNTLNKFKQFSIRDFQAPFPMNPLAPHPSGRIQDDYIENIGSNHYNGNYLRIAGGTTWHWAGHSWRFLPEDFKEYSTFGVGRDMPLTYEDLEPYYYKAERMMGVAGVSDPLDFYQVKRKNPYPLPPLPLSYLDSFVHDQIKDLGLSVKSAPSARNTMIYDDRPICCGSNNCMPICPIGAQYSASVHLTKAIKNDKMKFIYNAVVEDSD